MRVSGKRQGIDKWSNGWSFSTDFLRRKSKCKKKRNELNKDNSLTHFTLSVLLVFYKREEVEIRHEPYWYNKRQIPSLTSTQIVFFDEIHVQQVCGPPVSSKVNEHNIRFPREEEGNIDVKKLSIWDKQSTEKVHLQVWTRRKVLPQCSKYWK